jgi:gamma-tubulin complex component 3
MKIFSTGRRLNFIRYTCHDNEWIETQAKLANAGRGKLAAFKDRQS